MSRRFDVTPGAKLGFAEVLQEGRVRKDRVRLFESDTRGLEVASVEVRFSLVPADLRLLHFFGCRRWLRERGRCDEDGERGERQLRVVTYNRFKMGRRARGRALQCARLEGSFPPWQRTSDRNIVGAGAF